MDEMIESLTTIALAVYTNAWYRLLALLIAFVSAFWGGWNIRFMVMYVRDTDKRFSEIERQKGEQAAIDYVRRRQKGFNKWVLFRRETFEIYD